jgi:hypothetical protein
MAIRTQAGFVGDTDRYAFDNGLCSYEKGWAQIDTKQDASYYGNWCNPSSFQFFSFAEGDTTRTYCETAEEFVAEMRRLALWHAEHGYWVGIDPGFSDLLKKRFEDLGLGDLLH